MMINFSFPLNNLGLLITWATLELFNGCTTPKERLSLIYNIA